MNISQTPLKTMKIIEKEYTCHACPTTYDIKFEDGREGIIHYRWGFLYIESDDEEFYVGEQYGDDLEGMIDWSEITEWLKKHNIEDLTE